MLTEREALVARYVETVLGLTPGGHEYFDLLDRLIGRDADIHRALVDLAFEEYGPRVGLITSGGFGIDHRTWSRSNRARHLPVVLPGGLRHRDGPHYDSQFGEFRRQMYGVREWVFVDDSLYRGRTAQWVRDLVLMTGSRFAGVVVAYDGSRARISNVHSLYRYFDHHSLPQ